MLWASSQLERLSGNLLFRRHAHMANTSVLKHHINTIVEPLYDIFACLLDVTEVGI